MASRTLVIYAVASPYSWDLVESVQRTGRRAVCVDNLGGADDALPGLSRDIPRGSAFVVGLSSASARLAAAAKAQEDGLGEPVTLVDPTSVIASTASLAHGVYVNAAAVIASNTVVGCHSNVNRSASIGHDNRLGVAVSIGPGAVLAGGVTVGPGAFVGAGATVLPDRTIGRRAVVGAGSVVTRDVGDGEVVAGNPARVLKVIDVPEGGDACPHCSTD